MRLTELRKISEFYICQWEGDLENGAYIYARIRFDRFCIGMGISRQAAMNHAVNWPYIDTFIGRDDPEGPFHTKELTRLLTKSGFDCSQIDSEKVEKEYLELNNGRI